MPTVNVAKRAMTNASPRLLAVTTPSGVIVAELSLLVRKTRQVGHVAVGAVGVLRAGGELLRRAFAFEHGVLRQQLERRPAWRRRRRLAGRRPRASGASWCRAGSSSLKRVPPVCGTLPVGLGQQQALLGDGEVDAAVAISRVRR